MENLIRQKLKDTEPEYGVKIIFASESGSRVWGFASPDSDYDVRFIYRRKPEDYLKLNKSRDVIEIPIENNLDINGWDLDKTLRLLHSSNPSLFEWLSSPFVYKSTPEAEKIADISKEYFDPGRILNHYLSMAESHYKKITSGEFASVKKYLYVIRSILACKYVLDFNSPPPVPFFDLVKREAEEEILPEIQSLLELKMHSPEMKKIPKSDILNDYIEKSISRF